MQNNEVMKQWANFNKTAMDAMKELGEINTQMMTRLTQRQMEMASLYMETGAKQLEALSEVKGMQDMMAVQTRLFTELSEKLVDNARQTMEVLAEGRTQLTNWSEKKIQNVTDSTK